MLANRQMSRAVTLAPVAPRDQLRPVDRTEFERPYPLPKQECPVTEPSMSWRSGEIVDSTSAKANNNAGIVKSSTVTFFLLAIRTIATWKVSET